MYYNKYSAKHILDEHFAQKFDLPFETVSARSRLVKKESTYTLIDRPNMLSLELFILGADDTDDDGILVPASAFEAMRLQCVSQVALLGERGGKLLGILVAPDVRASDWTRFRSTDGDIFYSPKIS